MFSNVASVTLADGCLPTLSRHRRGRGRRLSTVRHCATTDGLSRPGALRKFVASLGQGSDQKYGAYHAIFGVSLTKHVVLSVTLTAYGSRFHAVQPTHKSALELM